MIPCIHSTVSTSSTICAQLLPCLATVEHRHRCRLLLRPRRCHPTTSDVPRAPWMTKNGPLTISVLMCAPPLDERRWSTTVIVIRVATVALGATAVPVHTPPHFGASSTMPCTCSPVMPQTLLPLPLCRSSRATTTQWTLTLPPFHFAPRWPLPHHRLPLVPCARAATPYYVPVLRSSFYFSLCPADI